MHRLPALHCLVEVFDLRLDLGDSLPRGARVGRGLVGDEGMAA